MKNVVIIGGGAAGIAAAHRLMDCGTKVLLLERSPRLGGRAASSIHHRMGEEVDYGQHVLMRCCTQTIALLEHLGMRKAVAFGPCSATHRSNAAAASLFLFNRFNVLPSPRRASSDSGFSAQAF